MCEVAGISKSTFYQHHQHIGEVLDERDFAIFLESVRIIDELNKRYGIEGSEDLNDYDYRKYFKRMNWEKEVNAEVVPNFGKKELRTLLRRLLTGIRHHIAEIGTATERCDFRLLIMIFYYLRRTILVYWLNNSPKRNAQMVNLAYRNLAVEMAVKTGMTAEMILKNNRAQIPGLQSLTDKLMGLIERGIDEWAR